MRLRVCICKIRIDPCLPGGDATDEPWSVHCSVYYKC